MPRVSNMIDLHLIEAKFWQIIFEYKVAINELFVAFLIYKLT